MARASAGADGPIHLLVTLDENYLRQLQVLLTSIAANDPGERAEVYLLHSDIPQAGLKGVDDQCRALGWALHPIRADAALFEDAPVTKRYPKEMYYRLLAPRLLPEHLGRILYLDPDMLVINPLRPLWETDLKGNLFAAASHTGVTGITNDVNRIRLGTESDYFNSGVLLMDLDGCRREVLPEDVFSYVSDRGAGLLLPDQDVLNAMYGTRILPLDDFVWNYDARYYSSYLLRSSGVADMDWVMANTAILHFCGRAKPWKPGYPYRFGVLYKHYAQMTQRRFGVGAEKRA